MSDIFVGQDGVIRDLDDDYQRGRTTGIIEERFRIITWLARKYPELAEAIGNEEHISG